MLSSSVASTCGTASVYWEGAGSRTASGERFNPYDITAAMRIHKWRKVHVKNMRTGKTITVRLNDFGPAEWTHRIIDLSLGAAKLLGVNGLGHVCID
jgi:rare lipoprotein A